MKYNTLNCSGIYVFSTWLNPFLEFAAKEENLVQRWIPWLILLLNITCRSCPEHITLAIIYLHSIEVLLYYKIDYPEFSLNEVKSPNSLSQDHLMGIVLTGYFHSRLALQGKFSLLSISLQILLTLCWCDPLSPLKGPDKIKELFQEFLFQYVSEQNFIQELSVPIKTPDVCPSISQWANVIDMYGHALLCCPWWAIL